jgi:hypothetical protein
MPGNGGVGGIPGGGGAIPGGGTGSGNGGAGSGSGGTGSGGVGIGSGGANLGGIGGVDNQGNANRAPGFIDLSPPMGAPLPATGTALTPPPPAGWEWYPIDGAICRDGSPTGLYVHKGTANNLLFFIEGGGACSNVGFCRFNPKNVNEVLAGDGATVLGTAAGAIAGAGATPRQQPGVYTGGVVQGVFDTANASNPFKDWSMVYIPYCTGDVHFGTKRDATVPGTPGADARDLQKHQFVGYYNMQKIVGRIVPTFSTVSRVVLTGISAGAFGAALNYSMIQDAFGNVPVVAIADSGVPFTDQYMPACMQKHWRDGWGLALPPDCTECQKADGGGLLGLADFLLRKHPNARIGLISTMDDEVIRLFFSVGLQNCANFDTADPVAITLGQATPGVYMAAADYEGGLNGVRAQYQSTNKLSTYFMPGSLHQHIIRPYFYTQAVGGKTLQQYVTDYIGGTMGQIGP